MFDTALARLRASAIRFVADVVEARAKTPKSSPTVAAGPAVPTSSPAASSVDPTPASLNEQPPLLEQVKAYLGGCSEAPSHEGTSLNDFYADYLDFCEYTQAEKCVSPTYFVGLIDHLGVKISFGEDGYVVSRKRLNFATLLGQARDR